MLPLLLACAHPSTDSKPSSASEDTDTSSSPTSPCADGTWMGEVSPHGLVFVRPDASAGGDGSFEHPFATIGEALRVTASGGGGRVALYPGEYVESVVLKGADDLSLAGCSAEETRIVSDDGRATVAMEEGFVSLRRVTIAWGRPAIAIRSGAVAEVADVVVSDGEGVGVQVSGRSTDATLRGVTIDPVATGDHVHGWGISLADGTLELDDVRVSGAPRYGVYAERGTLAATGLTISGGAGAGDPAGIYARDMDAVALADCEVTDVGGVGIHLQHVLDVEIDGCLVDGVTPSTLTRSALAAPRGDGDGIVVRAGSPDGYGAAVLTGNVVRDVARHGIVLTVDATLSGNEAEVVADPARTVSGDAAQAFNPRAEPLGRRANPGMSRHRFGRWTRGHRP